jgi:hypothetical protein
MRTAEITYLGRQSMVSYCWRIVPKLTPRRFAYLHQP